MDPVLEIPPEFDPDSTEFISDISDYATEYKKITTWRHPS